MHAGQTDAAAFAATTLFVGRGAVVALPEVAGGEAGGEAGGGFMEAMVQALGAAVAGAAVAPPLPDAAVPALAAAVERPLLQACRVALPAASGDGRAAGAEEPGGAEGEEAREPDVAAGAQGAVRPAMMEGALPLPVASFAVGFVVPPALEGWQGASADASGDGGAWEVSRVLEAGVPVPGGRGAGPGVAAPGLAGLGVAGLGVAGLGVRDREGLAVAAPGQSVPGPAAAVPALRTGQEGAPLEAGVLDEEGLALPAPGRAGRGGAAMHPAGQSAQGVASSRADGLDEGALAVLAPASPGRGAVPVPPARRPAQEAPPLRADAVEAEALPAEKVRQPGPGAVAGPRSAAKASPAAGPRGASERAVADSEAPEGGREEPPAGVKAAPGSAAGFPMEAGPPGPRPREAAPAVAAAPLPSPALQVAPAIVSLSAARAGGPQQVTIRLDPAELGHVQLRIIQADAAAAPQVEVAVERPETLRLLLQDRPRLEQALDRAGVPAEGRVVHLTLAAPAERWDAPAAGAAPASPDGGQAGGGQAGGGQVGGGQVGGGQAGGSGGGEAQARRPPGRGRPLSGDASFAGGVLADLPTWSRAVRVGVDITA